MFMGSGDLNLGHQAGAASASPAKPPPRVIVFAFVITAGYFTNLQELFAYAMEK